MTLPFPNVMMAAALSCNLFSLRTGLPDRDTSTSPGFAFRVSEGVLPLLHSLVSNFGVMTPFGGTELEVVGVRVARAVLRDGLRLRVVLCSCAFDLTAFETFFPEAEMAVVAVVFLPLGHTAAADCCSESSTALSASPNTSRKGLSRVSIGMSLMAAETASRIASCSELASMRSFFIVSSALSSMSFTAMFTLLDTVSWEAGPPLDRCKALDVRATLFFGRAILGHSAWGVTSSCLLAFGNTSAK